MNWKLSPNNTAGMLGSCSWGYFLNDDERVLLSLQSVGSAAPKTGDMLKGPPQPKFYEAVTVTEQTSSEEDKQGIP